MNTKDRLIRIILLIVCYTFVTIWSVSALNWSKFVVVSDDNSGNVHHFHHRQSNESYSDKQWMHFKQLYGKHYESLSEDSMRKEIYFKNLRTIEEHNVKAVNGFVTFTIGINKYSDMDHKEFVRVMNGLKGQHTSLRGSTYLSPSIPFSLPDTVDWRSKGYVTPIKDQGQCGSCWAFSSTGSLEGQLMRSTGRLVSLSEQNLVDCSLVWGNNGCEGGLMDNAFKYIEDNYGIDTEVSYPYTAKDGTCHYNASSSGGRDTGFVDLTDRTETQLKEVVALVGPVSVGIDASQPSFHQYKDGVYNDFACTQTIDHAVLVVGYGTLGTQDYWLVKNSWGTSWGQKGYVMMSRNAGNQCGIASMASYPLT